MIWPVRFLKRALPKGLLGRTLMIIVAPVLLIQACTSYFFIDRHLTKVTETLARQSAIKMAVAADLLTASPDTPRHFLFLKSYIQRTLDVTVHRVPVTQTHSAQDDHRRDRGYVDTFFQRNLDMYLADYRFRVWRDGETFFVGLDGPSCQYVFEEKEKNIFPRTTPILMWWAALSTLVFMVIAILFMRNQVRPLKNLMDEVDKFGRGLPAGRLRPSGSFEVRGLTRSFIDMRDRIGRFIAQRTDMLSGVSHDLRTPITRLELQLALMPQTSEVAAMKKDLSEMTQMIDAYLDFAKGDGQEPIESFDIHELLLDLLAHYDQSRLTVWMPKTTVTLAGRPQFLKRALQNVLDNSFKYAAHTWVRVHVGGKKWSVTIDDDGPGIPDHAREDVFRPFYRLEQSRNSQTGGVGLGLSIAREGIMGNGGSLTLDTAAEGGLRVRIVLPR